MGSLKKKAFRLRKIAAKAGARLVGPFFDEAFLKKGVPLSTIASHASYLDYLEKVGNHRGMRILEIGSREVTGASDARSRFHEAEYIGFDYYAGPNVDVVGDAHRISEHFEPGSFDVIYSSAVFEHLAMPWIVAEEIAKLLKVGGIVFVETHFSFSAHERPWHFFHFTDMGLKALFSPALGFECIEAGFSNPLVGRFSALADEYLRYRPLKGMYCHVEYLGKKVRNVSRFDWRNVELDDLVNGTQYPEPDETVT